jgi:hypothetical protein
MIRWRNVTEATILPAYQFLIIIVRSYSQLGTSPIHCIKMIYLHYQLFGGSCRRIIHHVAMTYYMAHGGECSDGKGNLLFCANDVRQMMCTIIVRDTIYKSWFKKKADCMVIIFYPSPAFGGVRFSCEYHTLTQNPWGCKLPPEEESSRCIGIHVHWQLLEYGQYLPETWSVLYLQADIIRRELTWGSLSTVSPNIDEWRANAWQDFSTCRMGLTRVIMVRLQSGHLNGHRWV